MEAQRARKEKKQDKTVTEEDEIVAGPIPSMDEDFLRLLGISEPSEGLGLELPDTESTADDNEAADDDTKSALTNAVNSDMTILTEEKSLVETPHEIVVTTTETSELREKVMKVLENARSIQTSVNVTRERGISSIERETASVLTKPQYPSLRDKIAVPKIRPLTMMEFRQYYLNAELQTLDAIIENFVETNQQMCFLKHPLHIYLTEYLKALKAFEESMKSLKAAKKFSEKTKEEVWNITDARVTEKGRCADEKVVTAQHFYRTCHLNEVALKELDASLENIRSLMYQNALRHKCTSDLSRFQVDCYLFEVLRKNPFLASSMSQLSLMPRAEFIRLSETAEIRSCISILFSFLRTPLSSEKFRKDVKHWLSNSVGVLQHYSTFYDQLFLLNHLLRSPSSVFPSGAAFVQLWIPENFAPGNFANPFVKHFITMLKCLLLPTKQRKEFLSAFDLKSDIFDSDPETGWIVLDADLEHEMSSFLPELQDNDIFSLLEQFPFEAMYAAVFGPHLVDLEPFSLYSERDVLGILCFCHDLLDILKIGLENEAFNRYSRFCKKVAQIIRETVIHCKEFWSRFVEMHTDSLPSSLENLSVQVDELIYLGFELLTVNPKSGVMQFSIGLPVNGLLTPNLYRIILLLLHGRHHDFNPDESFWKQELMKVQVRNDLEDRMRVIDHSDGTYLLSALASAAAACDSSHIDLIQSVLLEILKLCYLSCLRETYAKVGRDVVSTVCLSHPVTISFILDFVRKNLEQIGVAGAFLFQGLPLNLWQPTRMDMETICGWLCQAASFQDYKCLIAREILSHLNWDWTESGTLFVEPYYHYMTAVAVVDAFMKLVSGKNRRAVLYESLVRLSSMAVGGKVTPEQQFVSWCWTILLELKLHKLTHQKGAFSTVRTNEILGDDIPKLAKDFLVAGVQRAVQQSQPLACYVAVMMTDIGHTTAAILDEGLTCLNVLINNYLYIPVMQALHSATPLFLPNGQYTFLLQQAMFLQIISALLKADATYLRLVKNLISAEFPGPNLKAFGNMIIHQLLTAGPNSPLSLKMWTKVLTTIPNWNSTRETLFLLDHIVKFAFYAREFEIMLSALREAQEDWRMSAGKRNSGIGSLVSWMTAGSSSTHHLLDTAILPSVSWLAYAVLLVEIDATRYLWKTFVNLMTGEKKRDVDHVLKKAASESGHFSITALETPIYRLASLISDAPTEHEALPLLCQEFFKLFLFRSQNQISAGDRFFGASTVSKVLKSLKHKLSDVAEYYRRKSTDPDERFSPQNLELHNAFRAFSLWIDEARLHTANLYLPALPPEYEPQLLSSIIHPTFGPWTNFIDMHNLYETMKKQAENWIPFERKQKPVRLQNTFAPTKLHNNPQPPPSIEELKRQPAPFNMVDESQLLDPSRVLHALRPDLMLIQDTAKALEVRINQHTALDIGFVEMIAELNSNIPRETVQFVSCHKNNCSGPAEIKLQFKEFTRNEQVHRNYLLNRDEWLMLVSEYPDVDLRKVVISIVRFEKAISTLLLKQQESPNSKAAEVGSLLFYHLLVFMGPETDRHPLTSKFFSSCIEVLGSRFVASQSKQCQVLLETCLNNHRAVPMLVPHFNPGLVPKELLGMYRRLQTEVQGKDNDVLVQLLSAFDIQRWLQEPVVDVNARLEFLWLVFRGLDQLGPSPSFQDYPLFESYAHHVRDVLNYRFPLHVIDVLRNLLEQSKRNRMPQNGWMSCFLSVVGFSLNIRDLDAMDFGELEEGFGSFIKEMKSGRLSVETAEAMLGELTVYFAELRKTNGKGLYDGWSKYLNALAALFACTCCISVQNRNASFQKVVSLYQPWISNNPFSISQADLSKKIIISFRLVLCHLVAASAQTFSSIFDLIAILYQTEEDHVFSPVSGELLRLSWTKFIPSPSHIDQLSLFQTIDARKFIGMLLEKISWKQTVDEIMRRDPHALQSSVGNLIHVFVSYAIDPEFRPFQTAISHFLSELSTFDWTSLPFTDTKDAIQILLADPESIAEWNSGPSSQWPILGFLEVVLQFNVDNSSAVVETGLKRAMFLNVLGRASIAALSKNNQQGIGDFIKMVLEKVDLVWRTASPDLRFQGHLVCTSEVFSWSNYITDKKIQNQLRSALLLWISQSAASPLLIPMITACCRCVISMEHMIQYLELLIDAHFRGAGQLDWNPVIWAIETPEISVQEFVKECMSRQAFLPINAHVSKLRLTGTQGIKVMETLVDCCKVRPTTDSEAKVYLLWNQILQLAEGNISVAERSLEFEFLLRTFVESIFGFTEDRGGIFSAIGVGKPTPLSRHFKLVSRSLAAVCSPMLRSAAKNSSGKSTTLAEDTRAAYDAMKSRKDYSQFGDVFSFVDVTLASQGSLSWSEVRAFFAKMVRMLFERNQFLNVIWEG